MPMTSSMAWLKKQNKERLRRARISDQITQIHNLALSIVGTENAEKSPIRSEKIEMLTFCQDVLTSMAHLMKEKPEVKKKLCFFYKKNSTNLKRDNLQDFLLNPFQNFSDSGIHDLSSTSSCHNENSEADCITDGHHLKLPPKKRQQLWRPYL
nr:STARP-like antigen [Hymenolepis microstoma]